MAEFLCETGRTCLSAGLAKARAAHAAGSLPDTRGSQRRQDQVWRRVGDNARQVFLMQKVDGLMRIVMSSAGDLKVDRLTVLGGIGGNGGSGDLAGKLIAMSEQLKAATGLDMVQAVRERLAGRPVPPVRVGTLGGTCQARKRVARGASRHEVCVPLAWQSAPGARRGLWPARS